MTFEDEAEKYGVPPTMRSDDDDDDPNANVSYKDDNNNINNNIDDGNPGLPTDFCADASYCWEEADGAGGATPRPGAALSSFLLTSHDCAVKGVVPHENDVLMGRGGACCEPSNRVTRKPAHVSYLRTFTRVKPVGLNRVVLVAHVCSHDTRR